MAFSIRNIFQKGAQPEADPGGAAPGNMSEFSMFGPGGAATSTVPSPFGMPAAGAGGTGFGGSIFKARDQEEDMQGQPVSARQGGSAFSPFGAQEGVALTVGDLISQLPPELVRGGGAAMDQPVTISPQALEAALANGSLAVPVFEVYRVCPVLFQVPVSPQDPRVVPLPHGKLVAMMSGRGAPGAPPPQGPVSPFSSPQSGSPFAFNMQQGGEAPSHNPTGGVRPAGSLPPRRPAGVPPPIPSQADFAPMPSLQLPGHEEPQAAPAGGSPFSFQAPASPFAAQVPAQQAPMQSPFGAGMPGPFSQPSGGPPPAHQGLNSFTSLLSSSTSPVTDPELAGGPMMAAPAPPSYPAQAPAEHASPYGMPPSAGGSPFGMPGAGSPFSAPGAGSPFAAQPPMGGESPFASQGGGSPFAAQPPMGGESPFASQGGGSPFAAQPPMGGESPFASQGGGSPFAAQPPMGGESPFASQGGGSPFAAQPPMGGESPFASQGGGSPFAAQPPMGGESPFVPQGGGSPFAAQPQGGASPFAMPQAGESPFSPPSPGASPFAVPAGASPFSAPAGASPFSMPSEPAPGGSPFGSGVASFEPSPRPTTPEPPRLGAVPFGSPAPVAPAPASFTLPAMPAASRPTGGSRADESVDISLAAVLKGQTPQDLGFDPNFIPAWINTKLPAALVRDQLPSGQVMIDLGTIIDGTENTFRTVIAHGKREFNVKVPMNEIFHLLPPVSGGPGPQAAEPVSAPVAPPATGFLPVMPEAHEPAPAVSFTPAAPTPPGIIQPLGFQLPFSHTPPPRPEAPVAPAPEPVAPPAQPKVQAMASFDPFAANAGDWTGKSQTAFFEPNRTAEIEGGLGSDQLFAPAAPEAPTPAPTSFTSFTPPAASFQPFPAAGPIADLPKSPPAPVPDNDPFAGMGDNPFLPPVAATPAPWSAPAFEPEPLPARFAPAPAVPPRPASGPLVPPAFAPAPEAPARIPAFQVPVPASKGPSVTFGAVSGDPEQMLLRALLGAADKLDADRVVQLTAGLPGVLAAVAVMDRTVITHGDGDKAVRAFMNHAGETAHSMRSLASLIGFEGTETLSITSGERLITFTFADALAFGVLHADREPASGLRDKITLIGRELASLISRSRA